MRRALSWSATSLAFPESRKVRSPCGCLTGLVQTGHTDTHCFVSVTLVTCCTSQPYPNPLLGPLVLDAASRVFLQRFGGDADISENVVALRTTPGVDTQRRLRGCVQNAPKSGHQAFFSARAKPLSVSPLWQAESTVSQSTSCCSLKGNKLSVAMNASHHTLATPATCGQQQCEARHGASPTSASSLFALSR